MKVMFKLNKFVILKINSYICFNKRKNNMKSNYFLTTKALSNYVNTTETALIDLIFPNTMIKAHLVGKLERAITQSNFFEGLFWFYEGLDSEYTREFDKWFDNEVEKISNIYL